MRQPPLDTADFHSHHVVSRLVLEAADRERFFALREDRQLDELWRWRGCQQRDGRSRHTRLDVLQESEQETVGEVWRQIHPLVDHLLLAVTVLISYCDVGRRILVR